MTSLSTALSTAVDGLFSRLDQWPMAAANHASLSRAATRNLCARPLLSATCNPERVRSTLAKTDAASVGARPCFLCRANRPAEQEFAEWRGYQVLVNPYPIFPGHLTIASAEHCPQTFRGHMADFYALAAELAHHTVFFNGARCGASAPDHMHFQAASGAFAPSPIEEACNATHGTIIYSAAEGTIEALDDAKQVGRLVYRLCPTSETEAEGLMAKLIETRRIDEQMVNILARKMARKNGCGVMFLVIPRRAFRPWQYTAQGDEQLLLSPAAVEVAGCMVLPRKTDFDRLTEETAWDVMRQVCWAADDELLKK